MVAMTGGCSCGKIRFEAATGPAFVAVCHCRACQKAGGSAFAVVVAVPAAALTVTGDVTTYASRGDSGGGVYYRFCPICGSPISSNVEVFPDLLMIRAGTLDDPDAVRPEMALFCDSKQSWVTLHEGLQNFARMPG